MNPDDKPIENLGKLSIFQGTIWNHGISITDVPPAYQMDWRLREDVLHRQLGLEISKGIGQGRGK